MAAFPPNYGGRYCHCGATGCPSACTGIPYNNDDVYVVKIATPVKAKAIQKLPYWQQLNNTRRKS